MTTALVCLNPFYCRDVFEFMIEKSNEAGASVLIPFIAGMFLNITNAYSRSAENRLNPFYCRDVFEFFWNYRTINQLIVLIPFIAGMFLNGITNAYSRSAEKS